MKLNEELENELEEIVGSDNMIHSKEALADYSRHMSLVEVKEPVLVVRPGSREEVERIIRLANKLSVPLVPMSSGTPRLRGDALPLVDGAVIIDLRRLSKVLRVDRKNRVAMHE